MGEKQFEIKQVGVEYECDNCKQGKMLFIEFLASVANQATPYVHKCSTCDHQQAFAEKYPTVRFLRVENVG